LTHSGEFLAVLNYKYFTVKFTTLNHHSS